MSTRIVYVDARLYRAEELKDWCWKTIGNIDKWDYHNLSSVTGKYNFWFIHEEDALAFKLRFSK